MFEFKPLGETMERYPVPPEVLTYARAESNRNGGIRYVAITASHPIVHWNVAMVVDTREGVYVRCDCNDQAPHVIANDYSEKVDAITAKLNAEDDDSHIVDPNWLALDPNH